MAERKFVEDKMYIQGPNGKIWEYEALLAKQPGFKPVTPNKSKKAVDKEETSAKTGQDGK